MPETVLEKTSRTARIIALAMLVSVLIYMGIAEFYIRENVNVSLKEIHLFRYILYAIAVAEIFFIFFLRKLMLQKKTKLPSYLMDTLKQRYQSMNIPANDSEITFCQRLLSTTIITFALCESIAIYGLLLFILGKNRQDLYILAGLSLILMIGFFPSLEKWKNLLEHFKMNSQMV